MPVSLKHGREGAADEAISADQENAHGSSGIDQRGMISVPQNMWKLLA
jgi:hypothetical protein